MARLDSEFDRQFCPIIKFSKYIMRNLVVSKVKLCLPRESSPATYYLSLRTANNATLSVNLQVSLCGPKHGQRIKE